MTSKIKVYMLLLLNNSVIGMQGSGMMSIKEMQCNNTLMNYMDKQEKTQYQNLDNSKKRVYMQNFQNEHKLEIENIPQLMKLYQSLLNKEETKVFNASSLISKLREIAATNTQIKNMRILNDNIGGSEWEKRMRKMQNLNVILSASPYNQLVEDYTIRRSLEYKIDDIKDLIVKAPKKTNNVEDFITFYNDLQLLDNIKPFNSIENRQLIDLINYKTTASVKYLDQHYNGNIHDKIAAKNENIQKRIAYEEHVNNEELIRQKRKNDFRVVKEYARNMNPQQIAEMEQKQKENTSNRIKSTNNGRSIYDDREIEVEMIEIKTPISNTSKNINAESSMNTSRSQREDLLDKNKNNTSKKKECCCEIY